MDGGTTGTGLKTVLRRFRAIGLRGWSLLDSFLGARAWRGLSTFFLIGLTVAIFIFGQQLEDLRYEQARQQTIANLSADAGIARGNKTSPWKAFVQIRNGGPGTAYRTKLQLTSGSDGIRTAGSPVIEVSDSDTAVKVGQCGYVPDAGADVCIITLDGLYPDEYVQLTVPFAVDEQTSQRLLSMWPDVSTPRLAVPVGAEAVGDNLWALSAMDSGDDVGGRILSLFMPGITVYGQKILFQD